MDQVNLLNSVKKTLRKIFNISTTRTVNIEKYFFRHTEMAEERLSGKGNQFCLKIEHKQIPSCKTETTSKEKKILPKI